MITRKAFYFLKIKKIKSIIRIKLLPMYWVIPLISVALILKSFKLLLSISAYYY
jgi:hypothetical protein